MLGNDVRHDSESIASLQPNWSQMFESNVVTSVDWTSFNFGFEDFLSNLPCKHSSTVLLTN